MKQVVVPLTKYNKIKIIKYTKINEHTRSEIEMLFVESNWKFDGIWIWAFPTCWINLFESDSIDVVPNDINTDDVFISRFCPIFK